MSEETGQKGSQADNVSTSSVIRVSLIWTLAAFVLGCLGSYLGKAIFSAPYYFGFFMVFTLVGLSGLLALAVLVDKQQNERR